jgi:hypothetical protein
MRWPVGFLLGLSLLAAGCRTCEPVESELRAREHDVSELREEVTRLQGVNDSLEHELQAVRQSSSAKISPELAAQTYGVRSITLGRQTGGYDNDDCPGDEALQVVLEPHDPDGHTIKAPGSLEVQALEITPEGLKKPLSSWIIPPDQLRRAWRNGLLSTAYFVILPWKDWPSCDKLRVVARFTLADGRVFEADRDVVVHLTAPALRKPFPGEPGELPGLAPPEPETPLPLPRKLEPPPMPGGAAPAALWQSQPAAPLAGAAQLLRPVPLK